MTQLSKTKKRGKAPTLPAIPVTADPVQALNYMLVNNATPELVERAMRIVNEWNDRRAAEVFGQRFAAFQAELPQIEKTNAVNRSEQRGGELMYKFASLDDIERQVQPVKAKFGLSTSGTIKNTPAGVEAVWTIQIGSHKEQRDYLLPPTSSVGILQGGANATQNLGAWITYIRRYTYCMALGIVVRDEDTDANSVKNILLLSDEQRQQINDWISNGVVKTNGEIHKITEEKLLQWLQGKLPEAERSLNRITQEDFEKVVRTFKINQSKKPAT
jgi:hypothetical protein